MTGLPRAWRRISEATFHPFNPLSLWRDERPIPNRDLHLYNHIPAMNREALIGRTIQSLSRLPESQLNEVADFAEFLLSKLDDRLTTEGIQVLASDAAVFRFLEEEDDLYTVDDLQERFK